MRSHQATKCLLRWCSNRKSRRELLSTSEISWATTQSVGMCPQTPRPWNPIRVWAGSIGVCRGDSSAHTVFATKPVGRPTPDAGTSGSSRWDGVRSGSIVPILHRSWHAQRSCAAVTETCAGRRQESPGQSGCAAASAPTTPGCALYVPLPILDCPPLPDVDTRAR